MLHRIKPIRVSLQTGVLLTTIVFGLLHETWAATPVSPATPPPNPGDLVAPIILSGRQSTRPPGTYSAGVTEIIRLLDAKVEELVILAFVQDSPTLYDPDPAELVALKEHGASTELVTALLRRGEEVRLQLVKALNALNPPPAPSARDALPEPEPPPEPPAPDAIEVPAPTPYYTYVYGGPWPYPTPLRDKCRPYWYERGRWWPNDHAGHPANNDLHRSGAGAAPSVLQTRNAVSAPGRAQPGSGIAHPRRPDRPVQANLSAGPAVGPRSPPAQISRRQSR